MEYDVIKNQKFDKERALYHLQNTIVENCVFAGEEDGESVLKETRNVIVKNCQFSLRYPLWHAQKYELSYSTLDELTRAPIWYSHDGLIDHCRIEGIKILRECSHTTVSHCTIDSPEFCWYSHDITVKDSTINSEYIFLNTDHVKIDRLKMSGKYSFQYMHDVEIDHSYLDTKDAFWHSENVVVRNSVLQGEYLAWFSKNLTLIDCQIIGTQPFCYCENLKLIDCEMIDTDLAFEYSDVEASVKGHVDSIKNPKSGTIIVDSVGEVIIDEPIMDVKGQVVLRNQMPIDTHFTKECCQSASK